MNTFANATPRAHEGAAQRSIKWAGNLFRQCIEQLGEMQWKRNHRGSRSLRLSKCEALEV